MHELLIDLHTWNKAQKNFTVIIFLVVSSNLNNLVAFENVLTYKYPLCKLHKG